LGVDRKLIFLSPNGAHPHNHDVCNCVQYLSDLSVSTPAINLQFTSWPLSSPQINPQSSN